MRKQSLESRSSSSSKAKQNPNNINNSANILPNLSNDVYQIPGLKKMSSGTRNQARSGPIKVLNRELSPVYFAAQKGEQSESQYQSIGSQIQEINKDSSNRPPKIAKNQRAVLNLKSEPDQQISEIRFKKPASALSPKGLSDLKMKKKPSLNINIEAERSEHGKGPKSATNLSNGQFHFFEKNKTEISEAIFERDEADEEDKKDYYMYKPTTELKVVSADQTMIANQGIQDSKTLQTQEGPDSPTLFKLSNHSDILSFKLENRLVSESNTSALKFDFADTPAATNIAARNRGMFMNEHITQTEMEKQKEKKRLMKEALDLQLNEKKRKAEEEKLRQKEENQREEERIKKEMAMLKLQHEKETAIEMSKKTNLKTEEFENVLAKPNNIRIALPIMPLEKQDKHSSGSDNLDTRDTSTREEERILRSPAKVQRTVSRNRDIEPKSPTSPKKANSVNNNENDNNIDTLADENKKLRDENTKKEELIEALINALKQKDVGNFQSLHDKKHFNQATRDEFANFPIGKAVKTIETRETEADVYRYTFGDNNPVKLKYRAVSEQPSEANRFETLEPGRPMNEDKNSFFGMLDKLSTNKGYHPKFIRPVMPEYIMDFNSQALSPKDGYKPTYIAGIRNHDMPTLYGHSSSRVYSSPTANHLNHSSVVSPTTRMENKSLSFMPYISSNSQYTGSGPLTLEPIKSISHSSVVSPKNIYSHNSMLLNMTGNYDSVIRIKRRHEHSVDFAELNRENTHQEFISPASVRTGFLNEESALSKLNRVPKREVNSSSYPYNLGPGYQKMDIVDTFQYPQEDKNTSNTLETIHESDLNTNFAPKMLGKIIFSGNGPHKKMSGGVGKDKWVMNDMSLMKVGNKDEFAEKIKALPVLEGKSKFPKDVFSSNIRKKICP